MGIHFYLHIGFGNVNNIGVTLLNILITIGTWLGAIGTCIGAIAAINAIKSADKIASKQNELSEKIANRQSEQEDQEIRISLFDKRYEIYQCFMKYWDIANDYFTFDYNNNTNNALLELYSEIFDSNISNKKKELETRLIQLKDKPNMIKMFI